MKSKTKVQKPRSVSLTTALLFTLLVISVVLLIAFKKNNLSDSSSVNLKTYNNSQFGFSFQYPSDLFLNIYKDPADDPKTVFWTSNIKTPKSNIFIVVQVGPCSEESNTRINNKPATITTDSYSYNGIPVAFYSLFTTLKDQSCLVVQKHTKSNIRGHKGFDLDKKLSTELLSQDKKLFDSIVSSLKFTN